jgi:hypothetical protein
MTDYFALIAIAMTVYGLVTAGAIYRGAWTRNT